MAYVIEVTKRDVSRYAEECDLRGHNADECDEQCLYLDGEVRLIRDHGTSEYEYDKWDADEHGSPVEWAIHYLSGHNFPDLHSPGIRDGNAPESYWLNGTSPDPYKDEETEYHVYLRGDWTEAERGTVFQRAGVGG